MYFQPFFTYVDLETYTCINICKIPVCICLFSFILYPNVLNMCDLYVSVTKYSVLCGEQIWIFDLSFIFCFLPLLFTLVTQVTLFVCLFVRGFSSQWRIFNSYEYVTMTGEWLQILTYARHLWLLSGNGFLACHTYCDIGHPFIMVISEDLWQSHLLPSVWQQICHYLFLLPTSVEWLAVDLSLPVFTTYVCRGWDSNTQLSACGANALTHCAAAAATSY